MIRKRFGRQLHVLVTPELQQMLDQLAAHEHITPSDMVRALIRRAHGAAFGEQALTPTKATDDDVPRPTRRLGLKAPKRRK